MKMLYTGIKQKDSREVQSEPRSSFSPSTEVLVSHRRRQVEPALGILNRVLDIHVVVIRNSGVFNIAFLGNVAIDRNAALGVVDSILYAIVVVLESRFIVKNVALQRLELIALKVSYSTDTPRTVAFGTKTDAALQCTLESLD